MCEHLKLYHYNVHKPSYFTSRHLDTCDVIVINIDKVYQSLFTFGYLLPQPFVFNLIFTTLGKWPIYHLPSFTWSRLEYCGIIDIFVGQNTLIMFMKSPKCMDSYVTYIDTYQAYITWKLISIHILNSILTAQQIAWHCLIYRLIK